MGSGYWCLNSGVYELKGNGIYLESVGMSYVYVCGWEGGAYAGFAIVELPNSVEPIVRV